MAHRHVVQEALVAQRFTHGTISRIDGPGHIFERDGPHLVVKKVVAFGAGIPDVLEVVDEQEVVGQSGGSEVVPGSMLFHLSAQTEEFELVAHFDVPRDHLFGQEKPGESRFHNGEVDPVDVGEILIGHRGDH